MHMYKYIDVYKFYISFEIENKQQKLKDFQEKL